MKARFFLSVFLAVLISATLTNCKRIEYVDRFVVVPDTTWRPSVVMFSELYDAWERTYGQSIALPDTVLLNGADVCHFARRYSQEVKVYFDIRLNREPPGTLRNEIPD